MEEDLLLQTKQKRKTKPNANKEPVNFSEGKGVGYLTEKLEMCSL